MIKIKSFASVAIFALVTTVLTVFSGCSKDEGLVPDTQMDEKEMLVFKDYEEYSSALNKVLAFDEDELKVWEEAQGFKSFGRKCEELYESVNSDDYKSIEDLKVFINQNSNYLELLKMESGEYVLEVALEKYPDRYFFNMNKMYQIGDNVYKAFIDGVAIAKASEKETLKNIATSDEIRMLITKIADKHNEYTDIIFINTASKSGESFLASKWEENGKRAVKVRTSLNYVWADESGVNVTYVNNYINVRGYKKGLWWRHDKANISGSFKVRALYYGNPEYHYWNFPKKNSRIQEKIISGGRIGYGWFIPIQTVDAYYMWGKNHDGDVEAEKKLNVHLLP